MELENYQSEYARYANECKSNSCTPCTDFSILVDKSNMMNMIYFVLLIKAFKKQYGEYDFIGKIKPKGKVDNGDWGRISAYLSCFRQEDVFTSKKIFFTGTGGYKYQGIQATISYGRIMPLIPISSSTLTFLSKQVEQVFGSSLSERNEPKPKNSVENVIYRACLNYLLSGSSEVRSKDFMQLINKRNEKFCSEEFFSKIKDMSVLAFLIYCAHDRTNLIEGIEYIKSTAYPDNAKYNNAAFKVAGICPEDTNDEDILINAMDMADGLLQLIENIVFHAGEGDENSKDGTGFLSFRIYKNQTKSWSEYLPKQYKQYFQGHDNRVQPNKYTKSGYNKQESISSLNLFDEYNKKGLSSLSLEEITIHKDNLSKIDERRKIRCEMTSFYLEVKLVDNSGKNMCEEFSKKLRKDGDISFLGEKVKVSTFFDPQGNELNEWSKYTRNADNVVHHYGLQLFDALVQSLGGCFIAQSISKDEKPDKTNNFYSTSGDGLPDKSDEYFPGTQYTVLFPFNKRERNEYSFINTTAKYSLPQTEYSIIDKARSRRIKSFTTQLIKQFIYNNQKEKMSIINKLYNSLNGCESKNCIIVFDAFDLHFSNLELFAKALMKYIAQKKGDELNFAIINCEDNTFKQLIRIFAVFYDRTGNNHFMEKVQLYLSGINSKDEFLLAGSNLKSTIVAQIKLDVARGITRETGSGTISFLIDMLERRPGQGKMGGEIQFVPFDLLIKNNGMSNFDKNISEVLNADIQMCGPGCKISPSHMRIGSKIHIDSFYEAEMLFSNNYYTSRFAWLLGKKINEMIELKKLQKPTEKRPFLFVGYETYSEMLLRDLRRLFEYSDYCIFEYGTQDMIEGEKNPDRFRHTKCFNKQKNFWVIFIVPINSTLSTFNKLEAEFVRELKRNKIDTWQTAAYLGVIQNRHQDTKELNINEKIFFKNADPIDRSIISKFLKNEEEELQKVHYLFCTLSNWSNPLLCKQCYPPRYIDEKPLIETDKTSVIPTQMLGLKDAIIKECNSGNNYKTKGLVDELRGHVMYGHRYRGLHHYQYYIKTEDFFSAVNENKDKNGESRLAIWLKEVREKITYTGELHYDIIVYPKHNSSASFVKLVNDVVFSGASLVIGIDAGKEYRDNFIAKHNDLSSIYNNLKKRKCSAEINIHFVDDTIIHGNNFLRIRSLVYSLFPNDAFRDDIIKINVFKSIILLLNRNSTDSIMNYTIKQEDFHAYLNLSISSLRIHDDACILCREVYENDLLGKRAASNALNKRFISKRDAVSKKDLNTPNSPEEEKRGFLRLLCTHNLNEVYSALKVKKNDSEKVFEALVSTICTELRKANQAIHLDLLISYISIASSPFISFRKSSREAAFKLIIILLEVLLDNDDNTESIKDLVNIIEKTILTPEHKECLIKALMKQSVLLKSSFIIRQENIIRILQVSQSAEFLEYYLYNVKRLISTGTDEAKAMFLEFLLLYGYEYDGKRPGFRLGNTLEENFLKTIGDRADKIRETLNEFLHNLYIENTQILYDAFKDLSKSDSNKAPYFLENYKRILKWNEENENEISERLVILKENIDNGKTDDVFEYFSNLADSISKLLEINHEEDSHNCPELYFLSECKEDVLEINDNPDNPIVRAVARSVLDCFAKSRNANLRDETIDSLQILLNNKKNFVLSTYRISEDKNIYFIKIGNNGTNGDIIHIAICFKKGFSEYKKLRALRYVLVFRNQIRKKVDGNFSNDLLAKALRNMKMTKQLQKARASFHNATDKEELVFNGINADLYNPAYFAVCAYLNKEDIRDMGYTVDQALYAYFVNSTLGRVNIKLLANGDMGEEADVKDAINQNDTDEQKRNGENELIKTLSRKLSSVIQIPSKEMVKFKKADYFVDENRDKLEEFFNIEFSNYQLNRNQVGKVPQFNYLVAFIAELIINVTKNDTGAKEVSFETDDNGYFWVINQVKNTFSMDKIVEGLHRKGKGISLATICGFFDYFYKTEESEITGRVKIYHKDGYLHIGLPLFQKKRRIKK